MFSKFSFLHDQAYQTLVSACAHCTDDKDSIEELKSKLLWPTK